MRQGFVRGLALCALTVVALAPVATAGAVGDAGTVSADGGPRATVPPASPHEPITWAQVAAQLQERAGEQGPPKVVPDPGRAGAPAAAVAATPSLTVTPSTGLVPGQQVSVAGTGFAAGQYLLVECQAGGADPSTCDPSGAVLVSTDASGGFSSDVVLHRTLGLSSGRIDCATAPATCEMVALDFDTFTVGVRAPLSFDPTVPLPNPSIALTPSTGLLAGQQVSVAGRGFQPGEPLMVMQCAASDVFCFGESIGPITAGADGRFTTELTVHLRVRIGLGEVSDCLAVDCIVRAASLTNPDYLATAALDFDPSQPLPPVPAITVTPNTGLHHDQQVQVHGTGFDANSGIEITECGTDSAGYCDEFLTDVQSDGSGAFDVAVQVSRLVSTFGPSDEPTVVDCAPTGCSISAIAFDQDVPLTASAPIAFDASAPPPPLPVVTVTPDSDLPYRALVAVHGSGFASGEDVYAEYCINGPTAGSCEGDEGAHTADASGTVDFTIGVRRRVSFSSGEQLDALDCVDPSTTCSVVVFGQRGYERVRVAVTFDPDAPVPPPPSATITPDHDLGYRQSVALTGENFTPGPIPIEQCGTVTDPQFGDVTWCGGFAQTTADATGAISATVAVSRVLRTPFPAPLDCATTPRPCFLQVGFGGPDDSATVPLHFDPNSQPPPPPVITVSPRTRLRHGQTVSVQGSHFAPGALVGLAPCKRGATSIADDCDIARAFAVGAGPDGSFTTTTTVSSVLATARGPVDCTKPDGACIIAAANASDLSEFAHRALSFEVPDLMAHSTTVTEGTGTDKDVHVMVDVSAPSDAPRTIAWNAVPGTADASDYGPTRGTVTIPAGATEAMIHLHVKGDAIDEPTEQFAVEVDAPGTRVIGGTATVTIHDDDAAPTVSVHDARRREDHGEAHAEVLLSAPSGKTVIVHYVTHHVTARSGSDYVRKDSRLIFLPGQTRHLVRVVLVDDHVHEPTETFHVELDRVEAGTTSRSVATVTITDDD